MAQNDNLTKEVRSLEGTMGEYAQTLDQVNQAAGKLTDSVGNISGGIETLNSFMKLFDINVDKIGQRLSRVVDQLNSGIKAVNALASSGNSGSGGGNGGGGGTTMKTNPSPTRFSVRKRTSISNISRTKPKHTWR